MHQTQRKQAAGFRFCNPFEMEHNMYKTFTNLKTSIATAAASLALLASGPTTAGPGKPGVNPIAPGGTIIDIALEEFNGLLSAVLCFGPVDDNPIVDLLSGSDKYTLFAPVDSAFSDLLDRLSEIYETDITSPCQLDPELLFTVLAYHVSEGRRFSNSVFNGKNSKEIDMLAGGYVVSFVDAVDGQCRFPIVRHQCEQRSNSRNRHGVVADRLARDRLIRKPTTLHVRGRPHGGRPLLLATAPKFFHSIASAQSSDRLPSRHDHRNRTVDPATDRSRP
jgi:uncharacterized surface protein with fasciclin (FAS1) repeats